jgi:hypothetical protein
MSTPEPPPPPPTSPYGDNPKAHAKAAKAYAKASRPWYKKKRFLIPLALVVLIIIIAATSSGGGDDPESAADTINSSDNNTGGNDGADDEPEDDTGTKASLKFPKQNGDWRLDSLQVKDDGLGDFGAVGRITYTGDDSEGGTNLFTVTLFEKDGTTIVATLQGSASDVKPGQTVTTQFISTDPYKKGKFPSTFQNDL